MGGSAASTVIVRMTNLSHQELAEQAADIFLCDLFMLDPTIGRRFGRRRPLIVGLLDGFRMQGANVGIDYDGRGLRLVSYGTKARST